MLFIIVNRYEDRAILAQEFVENAQAWQHHAQPFIVARQIFSVDNLVQPILVDRAIDIIVINPALVASIIGWVDINTLHSATKRWQ